MLTREHLSEKRMAGYEHHVCSQKGQKNRVLLAAEHRASGECCLHQDSIHDGLDLARRYNTELRMEDGCNAQQWGMGSRRAHVAGI